MPIRPEKLAELTSIPVEAAQFILSPPADMSEQQLHSRLHELVPLTTNRRSWIWEIHKNCDQLIHQRLAAFTAAQAMTLASFSVLTIARFNAAPTMASGRLSLLDWARVWVVLFGIFLAAVGWLVTYPMFKRLNYLNQTFLFRDKIYRDYFDCIKWQERTWACETKKTDSISLFNLQSFHTAMVAYSRGGVLASFSVLACVCAQFATGSAAAISRTGKAARTGARMPISRGQSTTRGIGT